jgi:hypothetical protein
MRNALRVLLLGVVAGSALALASVAQAHGIESGEGVVPGEPEGTDQSKHPADPTDACPEAADPIELDSGGVYLLPEHLTTPDLVIPVRGHTIDLRRSYRQHYAYSGPLGTG